MTCHSHYTAKGVMDLTIFIALFIVSVERGFEQNYEFVLSPQTRPCVSCMVIITWKNLVPSLQIT